MHGRLWQELCQWFSAYWCGPASHGIHRGTKVCHRELHWRSDEG